MNIENKKAYVLHARNYRESSQLVDLFSYDFGRFRAVAKGVRGKRKSSANTLQPFCPLLVSWRGRGELKNLTMVEQSTSNASLHGEMLYIGLYLNELLVRLLPEHVPHESVFENYGALINQLGGRNIDPEPLLRRFELQLLEEIGYGLDLTVEMGDGRPIVANELYRFTIDQGFIRFNALSGMGKEDCFEGKQLMAIASENFRNVEVRRSAKRLLRIALQAHLGGRPLLSRQLFSQASVSITDNVKKTI